MKFLSKKDIEKAFSMRAAIDADKEALSLYSKGASKVPLRTNIDISESNGQSLYMPGYVAGQAPALGIKIVSVYPDNIKKDLPSVPATMVVLDPETGIVEAILDGTYLTQLRTGAVQGAATELLSNPDATIMGLIGTGGQARSQLLATLTVRKIKEVRIFDIDNARATAFAAEMTAEFGQKFNVTIRAVQTAKETVSNADIVTTVTTSKRPTFSAADIKPGAHINGVGAYTPEMHEIPVEIIQKADCVVFDTMDGVLSEAGDMMTPLKDGSITQEKYNGELGQLINHQINGREKKSDITIFKTVGTAVLDVIVADRILKEANKQRLGTIVE